MFAANAQLDGGPRLAPAIGGNRDELAHPFHIQTDERIGRIDALVDIGRQEAPGIVAADAKRRLRQIVGAEAEERRLTSAIAPAINAARGNSIIVPTR